MHYEKFARHLLVHHKMRDVFTSREATIEVVEKEAVLGAIADRERGRQRNQLAGLVKKVVVSECPGQARIHEVARLRSGRSHANRACSRSTRSVVVVRLRFISTDCGCGIEEQRGGEGESRRSREHQLEPLLLSEDVRAGGTQATSDESGETGSAKMSSLQRASIVKPLAGMLELAPPEK